MKLNAGLEILVIPLKAQTVGKPIYRLNVSDNSGYGESPFLPDRLYGSESSMIGGELHLLATATYKVEGGRTDLWFGHSLGTMNNDPSVPIWCGSAATCVSLWWTNQGLALTLERIDSLALQLQDFDVFSSEPFAGLHGLEITVDRILAGTGMTAGSTINELVGRIDDSVSSLASGNVLTQCIESPQSYRNTKLIEGLLVRVEPDASRRVNDKISPITSGEVAFGLADLEQSIAIPWKWSSVALVNEPVESGAKIAIREDGRCILLNLESMSVNHDYDGQGGRHLVIACIPEIARIGAIADNCASTIRILSDGTIGSRMTSRESLENMEKTRHETETFQRKQSVLMFEREFAIAEKFKTWTHGGQLVPIFWEFTENRVGHMTDHLQAMNTMVADMIDTEIMRTTVRLQMIEEELANRRLGRVAYESAAIGIGALALLVGLFMTTAMAPAWDGIGTINMWPWSFIIIGATVLVGIAGGWGFRKIRDGKSSE
ncbi:hypothetical protein [Glutamicibacter arilaitensis]|uniref:hypothetical protein n=1 Tax=Glutamicibacter arilaitensis TaxID=256701 RepID=UPI003FD61258